MRWEKGNNPHKKFKALDDFTAGDYFAKIIAPKVVDFLASKLNINQMNDLCRNQALLGHTLTTSKVCAYCEKDTKDKNFFKYKKCEKVIHVKGCALKYL